MNKLLQILTLVMFITRTKPKLYLARILRPVIRLSVEDDDSDYYDELPDLQVGYRRPELVNTSTEVIDLSDNIKIRLAVVRLKALNKYKEIWS